MAIKWEFFTPAELPKLEPMFVLDAVLAQVGDQAVDDLLHVELLPCAPVASLER